MKNSDSDEEKPIIHIRKSERISKKKGSSTERSHKQATIDDLLKDAEYQDIYYDLMYEPWFKKLKDSIKIKYMLKVGKLRTFKGDIPSTRDILDLKIGVNNRKVLYNDKRRLDNLDKMSSSYFHECKKFVSKFVHLTNPQIVNSLKEIESLEEKIMNQDSHVHSMDYRILKSDFDDKTKTLLYEKYMLMVKSHNEDGNKYKKWINTALAIPHHAKPIVDGVSMIRKVMKTLEEKIYGMEDAKEEMLCMLSNMIINPESKNKVIGMCGPPGIGKTMIAQIIAQAMDLPMQQISLGGITDSSFLEGHDFTYLGSEPGCITKAVIQMGFTNGIIFLDEIDKISKTSHGRELEHSLLHVIDFVQNHSYRDKYMPNIPINLSNFIFIVSMNSTHNMDHALLSRIPIINFPGYTVQNKLIIAEKFIMPELLDNYHINRDSIIVPPEIMKDLINRVPEEDENQGRSGVRNLKKILYRIIGRINLHSMLFDDYEPDIKLSFHIDNLKFPYVVTMDLINQIVKKDDSEELSYFS